jgi:hypothetical protein
MATDLVSLLQGGAQQQVREASRAALDRRLGRAQGTISSAVSSGGVNPLAAARQFNEADAGARAEEASALRQALVEAKARDAAGISQQIGNVIDTGVQAAGMFFGGPGGGQAAGALSKPLTGAIGTALGGALGGNPPDPSGGAAQALSDPRASGPAPFAGFAGQLPAPVGAPGIQGVSNALMGSDPQAPAPAPQTAPDGVLAERSGLDRAEGYALGGTPAPTPAPAAPAPAPAPRSALAASIAPQQDPMVSPERRAMMRGVMARESAALEEEDRRSAMMRGVMAREGAALERDDLARTQAQMSALPPGPRLAAPETGGVDAARRGEFNDRMTTRQMQHDLRNQRAARVLQAPGTFSIVDYLVGRR